MLDIFLEETELCTSSQNDLTNKKKLILNCQNVDILHHIEKEKNVNQNSSQSIYSEGLNTRNIRRLDIFEVGYWMVKTKIPTIKKTDFLVSLDRFL